MIKLKNPPSGVIKKLGSNKKFPPSLKPYSLFKFDIKNRLATKQSMLKRPKTTYDIKFGALYPANPKIPSKKNPR